MYMHEYRCMGSPVTLHIRLPQALAFPSISCFLQHKIFLEFVVLFSSHLTKGCFLETTSLIFARGSQQLFPSPLMGPSSPRLPFSQPQPILCILGSGQGSPPVTVESPGYNCPGGEPWLKLQPSHSAFVLSLPIWPLHCSHHMWSGRGNNCRVGSNFKAVTAWCGQLQSWVHCRPGCIIVDPY